MNQRKAWLGIGAVLLLLAVVIYWSSKEEPEVYPPYTSESPALNGLRGFYTLLEEQGQGPHAGPQLLGSFQDPAPPGRS